MANVVRVCRKCGAKILSDAPEGLCTGCVLETALGMFPDAVAEVDDPGSRHHRCRLQRVPLRFWEN